MSDSHRHALATLLGLVARHASCHWWNRSCSLKVGIHIAVRLQGFCTIIDALCVPLLYLSPQPHRAGRNIVWIYLHCTKRPILPPVSITLTLILGSIRLLSNENRNLVAVFKSSDDRLCCSTALGTVSDTRRPYPQRCLLINTPVPYSGQELCSLGRLLALASLSLPSFPRFSLSWTLNDSPYSAWLAGWPVTIVQGSALF